MCSAQVLNLAQPASRRRAQPLPYPDFPIERRVRSNACDFQLLFAEEAATRVHQRFDDALLVPARDGLLILGRHEQALQAPLEMLIALYPWQLEIGMARVRYQAGEVVREPVMLVKADVPRFNAQAVHEDLASRTEEPVTLEYAYDRARITAKARLARLLGYAQSLERFTQGAGEARMWLSEWAPVTRPEGPGGPEGPAAA
jgi:predicted membrane GTPase involved in stress response